MILMQLVVNFGQRSAKKRRGDVYAGQYLDQTVVKFVNIMKIMGGIFINSEGVHLAIVADGMGGHRAGDVASMMTIDILKESWKQSSHN